MKQVIVGLVVGAIAVLAGDNVHARKLLEYQIENKNCVAISSDRLRNVRIQWTGECRDGLAHGRGTLTYTTRSRSGVYEGEMRNGQFNGKGKVRSEPDGSSYVGDFINNMRDGQGTLIWANGLKYEGGFEKGRLNGEGVLTLPDGRNCAGIWDMGKFIDGTGTAELNGREMNCEVFGGGEAKEIRYSDAQ